MEWDEQAVRGGSDGMVARKTVVLKVPDVDLPPR
jgi:hypothetical protein